jgi:hypothetical protein
LCKTDPIQYRAMEEPNHLSDGSSTFPDTNVYLAKEGSNTRE